MGREVGSWLENLGLLISGIREGGGGGKGSGFIKTQELLCAYVNLSN